MCLLAVRWCLFFALSWIYLNIFFMLLLLVRLLPLLLSWSIHLSVSILLFSYFAFAHKRQRAYTLETRQCRKWRAGIEVKVWMRWRTKQTQQMREKLRTHVCTKLNWLHKPIIIISVYERMRVFESVGVAWSAQNILLLSSVVVVVLTLLAGRFIFALAV